MSWLLFNRQRKTIELFTGKAIGDRKAKLIGSFHALNLTDEKKSNGAWPNGTFDYDTYKPHVEDQLHDIKKVIKIEKGKKIEDFRHTAYYPGCFNTKYGCHGIHIFKVKDGGIIRTGMGVHAGRASLSQIQESTANGYTLGCIRTSDHAMDTINKLHSTDKLVGIIVEG